MKRSTYICLATWKSNFWGNFTESVRGRPCGCIEAFFQNLKRRGFDLESTHLRSLEKLSKLVGLVSLAYAFCVNVGLYYHEKVQPIKTKNHGYKANSFARYGLNQLRALLRGELHQEVLLWPLLQRLIAWLKRQLAHNQLTILAG